MPLLSPGEGGWAWPRGRVRGRGVWSLWGRGRGVGVVGVVILGVKGVGLGGVVVDAGRWEWLVVRRRWVRYWSWVERRS